LDTNEMTNHGFRSAASSILNKIGMWNPDAIERQLAHVDRAVERKAYNRRDFWDERVRMMAWWADRCAEMAGGDVKACRSPADAHTAFELPH
jgi:integrase